MADGSGNGTMRSARVATLQQAYRGSRREATVSVRGDGGCQLRAALPLAQPIHIPGQLRQSPGLHLPDSIRFDIHASHPPSEKSNGAIPRQWSARRALLTSA